MKFKLLLIGVILISLLSCNKEKKELMIFSAVSLTNVMTELGNNYMQTNKNIKLNLNLNGSGALANQIRKAGGADVYLSANKKLIDELENENLVDKNSTVNLLRNSMVVITGKNSNFKFKTLDDLLLNENVKHIAIGNPDSKVPAGVYAKQVLKNKKLFEKIKHKFVPCENTRIALAQVENNNAEISILFKTGFMASKKTKLLIKLDKNLHDDIIYPVTIPKDSKNIDEAKKFIKYLQLDENIKIFEKYGFKRIK